MSIPPVPSYSQMPNNLSELLNIQKNFHRSFSNGLTNLTKTTNTRWVRSERTRRIVEASKRTIEKTTKEVGRIQKIADKAKIVTDNLQSGKYSKISASFGRIMGFILPLLGIGLGIANFLVLKQINESTIKNLDVLGKSLDVVTRGQQFLNNKIKANTRKIEAIQQDVDLISSKVVNNRKLIKKIKI